MKDVGKTVTVTFDPFMQAVVPSELSLASSLVQSVFVNQQVRMSKECVICGAQESRKGRSSEMFSMSQRTKGNLGFMLNFVSGLKAQEDNNLCVTCCDELQIAFNFKQKWRLSDFYHQNNGAAADHERNGEYKKLETEKNYQSQSLENSKCDTLDVGTHLNNGNNNDKFWKFFKREKSIEIEEELPTDGSSDLLINKTEDLSSEGLASDGNEAVIQLMIFGESSELTDDLEEDENIRNNEQEPTTVRCEICDKTFAKISTCRIHLKRMHASDVNRVSRNVKGRRKYPISKHDIFSHLKETQCEFCFTIFRNSEELKGHKKCHEAEEQPYRCNKLGCSARFSYKHRARSHIVNHVEKRFKCSYCDKTFSYSYNTKVHERTHTGEKPFVCSYCGRGFASLYNMTAHVRLHTGEEPYKCRYCPKSFKSHSAHKIHEKLHTHEKPYKCSVCGKDFISSWSCKSHKRIHTGEKPYHCQICKKAFRDSTTLHGHEQIHNGTAPKRRRKLNEEK